MFNEDISFEVVARFGEDLFQAQYLFFDYFFSCLTKDWFKDKVVNLFEDWLRDGVINLDFIWSRSEDMVQEKSEHMMFAYYFGYRNHYSYHRKLYKGKVIKKILKF